MYSSKASTLAALKERIASFETRPALREPKLNKLSRPLSTLVLCHESSPIL